MQHGETIMTKAEYKEFTRKRIAKLAREGRRTFTIHDVYNRTQLKALRGDNPQEKQHEIQED